MASFDSVTFHRIADAPRDAIALAARGIAAQPPSPWRTTAHPDPSAAAELALKRHLDADPLASGWVARQDGRPVALLATTLEVVTEDHFGYTYLHPRHASMPASSWTATTWEHARALFPGLLECIAQDAHPHDIRRLLVQTRPHDWIAGSWWRGLGMRPDSVLAAASTRTLRTRSSPGLNVRAAVPADEEALVRLAFHEYEHHARYTRTGTLSGQSAEPTRR